jgi:integrase
MKLTKRQIDKLEHPTTGQKLHFDDDQPGFGVRVTPTRMTYIAQGRVAGRTVRVTLGSHGPWTPDMARVEARKALADMDRGIDRNKRQTEERLAGVTLDQAYRAYVGAKELAESTRHDYEKAMQTAFHDWKSMPLPKINGGMVSRLFEVISERGPTQANRHFRFLRALLGWAMWEYASDGGTPLLPANPCEVLSKQQRWNAVQRRERHIEQSQLAAFMHSLRHLPDDCDQRRATKDLCALLVLTGLREQEGCGLRWTDVDLDRRVITARKTKNGKDHTLPIGEWLATRLLARRLENKSSVFVFPAENKSGHLINHRKHVLAIVKASGVEFRLHDLRRTFASIGNRHLERSLSQYTIKRLLNHSSGGDVTAGYIQLSLEDLREPMEMVERFVRRSAGMLPSAAVLPLAKAA